MPPITADVCVYGGTSGGVAAAVQAARMGLKTVLIEPGRHLGGMTSGGLGWTDIGVAGTIGGVSREFYERIYRFYHPPKAADSQAASETGRPGPTQGKVQFLFEPHVAETVFDEMVREAGVQVIFGERLDLQQGVTKEGTRVTRIRMESGREFAARVFIDAGYEGDLVAKAGISYIVGREPNSQYGETLNGARPFTPRPFPTVSPYVVADDPASGLLPRVEAKPPGAKGTRDSRVQGYNFRVCLTDAPANRLPIAKPATYNPLDYELLARWIATRPADDKGGLGVSFSPLPNRKTDSNNGGEFGSELYGPSYGWPEGNYAERDRIFALHKNYTLGLLWFLGNDPRVPENVRTKMQRWGLPKDEFKDSDHFPHQLYVREARRMIGDFVFTENHARRRRPIEDPIAIGSYTLDSHGVTLYVDEQGVLTRERGFFERIKPYPIPYRILCPRASECDNLLTVSALSCSHAAYGSVRMEPVFMMLGQAAATAADFTVKNDVTVQNVPYGELRKRLVADRQILTSP